MNRCSPQPLLLLALLQAEPPAVCGAGGAGGAAAVLALTLLLHGEQAANIAVFDTKRQTYTINSHELINAMFSAAVLQSF
jgi:hypothetical protein